MEVLIYGGGKQAKELGVTADRVECPQCGVTGRWVVFQTNMKAHVYFVPVAKWNKKFFAVCSRCDAGIELEDRHHADRLMHAALAPVAGSEATAIQLQQTGNR